MKLEARGRWTRHTPTAVLFGKGAVNETFCLCIIGETRLLHECYVSVVSDHVDCSSKVSMTLLSAYWSVRQSFANAVRVFQEGLTCCQDSLERSVVRTISQERIDYGSRAP